LIFKFDVEFHQT